MKTQTLSEFLLLVNSNRDNYGDMIMNKVKKVANQLEITFSEVNIRYVFYWNKTESNWYFLMQELNHENDHSLFEMNKAS